MQTLTKVQYLRRVTSPRSMVGRPGEFKTLPEHEADQLVSGGYAQIIEAGIPLPAPPEEEEPVRQAQGEPAAVPKPAAGRNRRPRGERSRRGDQPSRS